MVSFTDQSIKTIGVTPAYIVNGKVLEYDNVFAIGLDWYQDSLDLDRFADVTRTMETLTADVFKETLGLYARNEGTVTNSTVTGRGPNRILRYRSGSGCRREPYS